MPATLRTSANPKILVWARESAGFTVEEAARSIGVTSERLSAVESGDHKLTLNQLKSAANKYKRSLALFYAPEAPGDDPDPVHDFRTPAGVDKTPKSPALQLELRRAMRRRRVLLDLGLFIGSSPPLPDADVEENPEEVAHRIRVWLGSNVDVFPRPWRSTLDALNGWISVFEQKNILVFQSSGAHAVDIDEMRGFSVSLSPLPIIVLNGRDAYAGRIFTLFHELIHITLRNSGLCQPVKINDNSFSSNEEERIEVFCNRVAGLVLMPTNVVLQIPEVQASGWDTEWNDESIESLAAGFCVSREALLLRLLTLRKTNQPFYRSKREQYLEEYRLRREEEREESRQRGGTPIPPSRIALVRNGRYYSQRVLDALDNGMITYSDASEYLGIRFKHIDSLNDLVRDSRLSA